MGLHSLQVALTDSHTRNALSCIPGNDAALNSHQQRLQRERLISSHGSSVDLPVKAEKLALGTWKLLYACTASHLRENETEDQVGDFKNYVFQQRMGPVMLSRESWVLRKIYTPGSWGIMGTETRLGLLLLHDIVEWKVEKHLALDRHTAYQESEH